MLQLFVLASLGDMVVILILLFRTPLRKLLIMLLDRLKQGRGPLVVKTVGGVLFAMLSVTVYNIADIRRRPIEAINPTDQILLANYMLEASFMGFSLFLSLMIDRLHHYIRELERLRTTMDASKKQNRSMEEAKSDGSDEIKGLGDGISLLKTKIKQLESECETTEKEVKAAEANVGALSGQSEGLLMEYDRLLKENQNFRNELQSIDQNLSHSDVKKNT